MTFGKSELEMEKDQLRMYWNMIGGALKNKGVWFILLCFFVAAALCFAYGYYRGIESVPPCVECLIPIK